MIKNQQNKIKNLLFFNCFLFMPLFASHISWNGQAAYLFAPGLWSSEHQAAKYCSQYYASTGECVTSTHGFEVIQGNTTIACNFPEIVLQRLYKTNEVYFYMIPGIVITSLLTRLGKQILDISNQRYQVTITGKPAQELSINPYLLNILTLNFGQTLDVDCITQAYQQIMDSPSLPADVILYGVSRGAVAAFNFVATVYNPTTTKRPIKAIILESCFDSLDNMISFSYLLSLLLPHYTHTGIAPINPEILENFVTVCNQYNIPVLLISSLADQRVPYKNTQNLYEQLKDAGLKKLDFLILQNSIHSGYSHDDINDTHAYLQTVHNFYKKHTLPFIEKFAEHNLL